MQSENVTRKLKNQDICTEIDFSSDQFFSNEFGKEERVRPNPENACCWTLNSALSVEKQSPRGSANPKGWGI